MISVVTKSSILYTRQEIWFYHGEKIRWMNNNLFFHSHELPAVPARNIAEHTTSVINLQHTEEKLFNNIKSGFRYEILKAEKEAVFYEIFHSPSQEQLKQYIATYQSFAHQKKIPGSRINLSRLTALSSQGVLTITSVRKRETPVTFHLYIIDGASRVRLLYSHHELSFNENSARGTINKYHHWMDFQNFKNQGIAYYDWGGIDTLETPAGIAQFKLAFGGNEEKYYSFQITRGLYSALMQLRRS